MSTSSKHGKIYDTVIIGGGPAGTGLLLKALKDGSGNTFLSGHIALVERSSRLIKGNITGYQVNSDTFSDVFLECLEGCTGNFINLNELHSETDEIKTYQGRSIPLQKLDPYFNRLGELLKESLTAAKKCEFFMNTVVSKITRKQNGTYEVFMTGETASLIARQIIIATGGTPKTINSKESVFVNGISPGQYKQKIIHSDTLLRSGLPKSMETALIQKPKVVILGGSHSAFSTAHFLLQQAGLYSFDSSDIKIWCKTLPKIYFNNREDAELCGYSDFTDEDICPVTKKLYRLAGLRMDGRALYMQMLGLGHTKKETRVQLNLFANKENELKEDLDNATLIISALGYRLNIVPIFDEEGKEIRLKGEETGHWVNDNCELLDENGSLVPNIFASGLATGFIPNGDLGGEPSFQGQTNGIWYYQNAIAGRIMRNLARANQSQA